MNDIIKQVIVFRKDLNMRKSEIASQAAIASIRFLTDNNEANRYDEILVKLSPEEASWISGSYNNTFIAGTDSRYSLENLIFKAKLKDIEVHPIEKEIDGIQVLTCAAFGPCESRLLDTITGNLKNL